MGSILKHCIVAIFTATQWKQIQYSEQEKTIKVTRSSFGGEQRGRLPGGKIWALSVRKQKSLELYPSIWNMVVSVQQAGKTFVKLMNELRNNESTLLNKSVSY